MSTTEAVQQMHLIAGEWQPSGDAATFERANPFNGEATTIASAASRADVRAAIDAASGAFPTWSGMPAQERSALLEAAADLMSERAPQIARTMTEECGATFGWGMFNCQLASGMLRAAAAMTDAAEQARE